MILGNDSVKKLTVYTTNADLTIKIPSAYVELFMDSVNHLSTYVDERKMDIEDRTLNYLSEKLKAENRESSVALRSNIKLTQRGADSILILKDDIVDRKISNLRTDEDVKYSTLTLNLYQNNRVYAEVVANDDLSAYKTPLLTRSAFALSKGWSYFSELVIGVLQLWVFIIAAIVIWVGIKMYKKNKTLPVS